MPLIHCALQSVRTMAKVINEVSRSFFIIDFFSENGWEITHYEIIPDEQARQDDFVRVIDESGEDYLYHVGHFIFIELPEEVEQVLVAA